ncbi:MAG: hypothetical protein KF751_01325 [Nitrospira sp.]|nr:hypothetical protein [Nitrospira sp.]
MMQFTILESSFKCGNCSVTSPLLPSMLNDGIASHGMGGNYDTGRILGRKTRHLNSATLFFGSTAAALLETEKVKHVERQCPDRVGIYVTAETINLEDDFCFDLTAKVHGPDYVSPMQAPNTLANVVGSHFASFAGITGPNCTIAAGQTGGFQAIQVATLGLSDQSIDMAIVGGVEVCSEYHRLAYVEDREVSVAHGIIRASQSDRLVFYPPITRLRNKASEAEIAQWLKSELGKQLVTEGLDAVLIAFKPDWLILENLHSTLCQIQVTKTVLVGEGFYGRGESCSALLAIGVGADLLRQEQVDWHALGGRVLGKHPSSLSRLGIIGFDEQGQFTILLMEKRSCLSM